MKIVLSKLLLNLSCYLCQFFVSWWSYSDCLSHSVTQPGEITSRRCSTELAHEWNKAVDETLGRLVVYLSSRGWWFKHHFEHGKWGGAQDSARLSSHCCAETQLMYLTFLCTRSWTCFLFWKLPQWPIYFEYGWFCRTLFPEQGSGCYLMVNALTLGKAWFL